jgi:hypothetical protein
MLPRKSTAQSMSQFDDSVQPSSKDNTNAQLAIIACSTLVLLFTIIPLGGIGKILIPASVISTGIFLYAKSPLLYVGFTWWVWFLAPFISRVVEYKSGSAAETFRLIILTPYILSFISVDMVLKKIVNSSRSDGLPFALAGISIFYSMAIGYVNGYSLIKIGQEFLSWSAPVCFGFFMLSNWRRYESLKKITQLTFLLITAVISIYGIIQYLEPPAWDVFWWENAENVRSASGIAVPKMVRVWSTLNTTFLFAYAMVACLGVTLTYSGIISIPILISGIISILLSQVRVSWFAIIIVFFIFMISTNPRASRHSLLVVILSVSLTIPLSAHPDFNEVIQERIATLSQGKDDVSLQERQSIYQENLPRYFDIIGKGLGSPKIIDAGAADVLSTLGWVGTAPMMLGILLTFHRLFRFIHFDKFRTMMQAVPLGFLATLAFNNIFILLSGQIFWSFIGLALAADRYQKNEKS